MVTNVSRVWKPDETLALVFEILRNIVKRGRPVGYLQSVTEDLNSGLPRNKFRWWLVASNCIADLLFKVESPLLLQYVETKANLSLRFGIKQLDDYLEQQVGCAFLH